MSSLDYSTQAPSAASPVDPAQAEDGYTVAELRKQYTDWSNAKRAEIQEQIQARHYYHGDQLTDRELKVLKKRRQPPIIFNRVNRKIDGVVGTLKKLWQDAKAFPRTPHHDDDAELVDAALRYALDVARWKQIGVEGTRNGAREGIGVIELLLESGDKGDPEIGLAIVDDDTWFYDPRSFRPDFSDARYMGVAKWLDVDVAKEMYPDHADELGGLVTNGTDIETWAQADREKRWVDVSAKRVRVIEHWYVKGGQWHACHYSAGVKLAGAPSPFRDEKGKSMSKYIGFTAYVDHDGDRYGFVRHMKSPQDELNMRRSKALHILNTRRISIEEGAISETVGIERFRTESTRPDGVMIFSPGALSNNRVQFEDGQKQAEWQGQMEMLSEAKAEIENFGPTLIEKGNDKSGKAIALLQQAGLSELGPFIDSWLDWKLRVYRAVWNAIRQHWTAERWIRVTDDEGAARFVQLNGLQMDPYGQPQLVNAVAQIDVDIILDEAPDSVSTMQDVFELLESLAAAGVPVPPKVVIEMSGLPSSVKKRVIAMIEQASQADPAAEAAKQVALDQENSKTKLNQASAQDKVASAAQRWATIGHMPDKHVGDIQQADAMRSHDAGMAGMGQAHEADMAGQGQQHEAYMAALSRAHEADQADQNRAVQRQKQMQPAGGVG